MDSGLTAYWFTFPEDGHFPIGMGVTARSLEDARTLFEERGFDFHRRAKRVVVLEGVELSDLCERNVVPYSGPLVCRGVWYPSMNTGFAAPR